MIAFQQAPHLIQQESIRTASERGHLHKVNMLPLLCNPLGGLEDPVNIRPLRNDVGVLYVDDFILSNNVFRDHGNPVFMDHIRYLMLDERIGMIRPAGQQDGQLIFTASFGI